MSALDHFAEPFNPTGSLASEGVRNQLGRPRKDAVEVLVREALQNCWDAKRPDADCVDVSIDIAKVDPSALTTLLGASAGQSGAVQITESRWVLRIADRGTKGLGGVLRADQSGGQEQRDFVDFFRNIGQPPDTERGGGTYGYGKVALFAASRHGTIFAHTGCVHQAEPEVRFMLARLGNQYATETTRYTGRHWWGRIAEDGIIDPLLDDQANDAAEALGLPSFELGEFGTTIGILDPDFGGLSYQQAGRLIAECVAWNFWPKLTEVVGRPPAMTVSVTVDGQDIPIPSPDSNARLRAFADAFQILKSGAVAPELSAFAELQDLECGRPIRHLGRLALLKHPHTRPPQDVDGRHPSRPGERVRHVCLLRAPELVVNYLEVAESPSPTVDYAGVFLADDSLDRVFAASEPPTHDDWVPDGLPDPHHRTFVRVTERRIQEAARKFIEPIKGSVEAGKGTSLAHLSDLMGALIPDLEGHQRDGEPPDRSGGGGAGGSGGVGRVLTGSPSLVLDGVHRSLDVPFVVEGGDSPVAVTLKAGILLDTGGVERDPPAGTGQPEASYWTMDGQQVEEHSEGTIQVAPPFPRHGLVRVRFGSEAAIQVELKAASLVDGGRE